MGLFKQIVTNSFWGRFIYNTSGHRLLNYKEEQADYVLPETLQQAMSPQAIAGDSSNSSSSDESSSEKVVLDKNEDDKFTVTWDGDDDPENPYNWPLWYKVLFVGQICFLTTLVYMASAIYTPGITDLENDLGVGRVVATLPLTLFVFGYGIGPMVLLPLSENAYFGRTSIYVVTLFVFFILQIPTALTTNIAGLCVARFLAGFFASPCLATGGASIGDVTPPAYMPLSISAWSFGAVSAPALGPLIGAAFVTRVNYHWPFWFVAITSGTLFLTFGFLLPESSTKALLYRKAERLRRVTGDSRFTSEGHLENESMTVLETLRDTFWRPFEIMAFEPVVLLINIYLGFIYAVMYLWFEAFPIVFLQVYNFTLVEMGTAYLSLVFGAFLGVLLYYPVVNKRFTQRILKGDFPPPEVFLPICIAGAVLMPIALVIISWTATPSVHWIAPLIGATLFVIGAFIVFQTLFNYLGMSFYRYLASVFAGNAFFRSMCGGAFPLFGQSMFDNLSTNKYPVAWGMMILMFITILMVLIPVLFYINGPKLRARSKYAN